MAQETIEWILAKSETVENPYAETDIGYLLITVNPCAPILREVPLETPSCYRTLTDAKEAARQVIQNAITEYFERTVGLRLR